MKNVYVRPCRLDTVGATAIVPDPRTGKPLAAAGEWKPLDQFWSRRLRDRDVEEVTPPALAAPAAAAQVNGSAPAAVAAAAPSGAPAAAPVAPVLAPQLVAPAA